MTKEHGHSRRCLKGRFQQAAELLWLLFEGIGIKGVHRTD